MEALFSDYEAIRKSGLFDPEHYAKAYPDIAERNVDPLVRPFILNSAARGARSRPTRYCIICWSARRAAS